MLAAEPSLDAVCVLFLTEFLKFSYPLFPVACRTSAQFRFIYVGQQIALEHISGREREPTIIHRFEDCVGVLIGVGGDLDQMNVFDEPVYKVRQDRTANILELGKVILN